MIGQKKIGLAKVKGMVAYTRKRPLSLL